MEVMIFMAINLLRLHPSIFQLQLQNLIARCRFRQKSKSYPYKIADVEQTIKFLNNNASKNNLIYSQYLSQIAQESRTESTEASQP